MPSSARRRGPVAVLCALAVVVAVAIVAPGPDRTGAADPWRLAADVGEPDLGTIEELRQAWTNLPDEQKQQTLALFRDEVMPRTEAQLAALPDTGPGSGIGGLSAPEAPARPVPESARPAAGAATADEDLDNDGLGQGFEDEIAGLFRPLYHVSDDESATTGTTRFADRPDRQDPIGPRHHSPPLVHIRVKPFGIGDRGGQRMGFLRVDYLTLWNRDDGYVEHPQCPLLLPFIFEFLFARGHEPDNERSATIVGAPVLTVDGEEFYNPDPGQYKAFEVFTTAHEDDPLGHYANTRVLDPPVDPGHPEKLQLWLSLSKHGTYDFDPDGRVVLRAFLHIVITIGVFVLPIIFDDFFRNHPYLYFTIFIVTHLFISTCIAETFRERPGGPQAPTELVNVGEPGHPLNGSSYIEAPKLREKFTKPPRPAPDLVQPTPVELAMDNSVYVLGERPLYQVRGAPGGKIRWSSSLNGVPTGENDDWYGDNVYGDGRWSGYGLPWEERHLGVWTKRVKVAGLTATASFTVARVRLTRDKAVYRAEDDVLLRVKGAPNTPIRWTTVRNGQTVDDDADYGDGTDANGDWSGYRAFEPGTWTARARLGGDVATTTFRVRPPRSDPSCGPVRIC